ncbi:MAG: hypothetical protein ACJASQ_001196 [Crocinitomicaceae bacterium]|jgi:hypothetical protein
MKYSITVEVNSSQFQKDKALYFLEMKDVFLKYDFSILTHTQEQRLVYLAEELSSLNRDTLAFNACYNLEEVWYLNNELKKYNHSLDTVYIPSDERVEKRKQKAIAEQQKWGYREGISDEEIERNFINFKATLQEIKEGVKNTPIQVVEC